tara:strand:- start:317 stop:946 length:630 start_codon:yes stop_codon:yes gene_type:complete
MLKKMVTVVTIVFSLVYSKDGSIPEWYMNPPNEEDRFFGVGEGDSRIEAILKALNEIEGRGANPQDLTTLYIDSTDQALPVEVFSWGNKTISSGALLNDPENNFQFSKLMNDYAEERSTSMDSEVISSFEMILTLKYGMQDQDVFANFEYYFKEAEDFEIIKQFKVLYKNIDEKKVVEKIEELGYVLKFYHDPEYGHFVLLSIAKSLIK